MMRLTMFLVGCWFLASATCVGGQNKSNPTEAPKVKVVSGSENVCRKKKEGPCKDAKDPRHQQTNKTGLSAVSPEALRAEVVSKVDSDCQGKKKKDPCKDAKDPCYQKPNKKCLTVSSKECDATLKEWKVPEVKPCFDLDQKYECVPYCEKPKFGTVKLELPVLKTVIKESVKFEKKKFKAGCCCYTVCIPVKRCFKITTKCATYSRRVCVKICCRTQHDPKREKKMVYDIYVTPYTDLVPGMPPVWVPAHGVTWDYIQNTLKFKEGKCNAEKK